MMCKQTFYFSIQSATFQIHDFAWHCDSICNMSIKKPTSSVFDLQAPMSYQMHAEMSLACRLGMSNLHARLSQVTITFHPPEYRNSSRLALTVWMYCLQGFHSWPNCNACPACPCIQSRSVLPSLIHKGQTSRLKIVRVDRVPKELDTHHQSVPHGLQRSVQSQCDTKGRQSCVHQSLRGGE